MMCYCFTFFFFFNLTLSSWSSLVNHTILSTCYRVSQKLSLFLKVYQLHPLLKDYCSVEYVVGNGSDTTMYVDNMTELLLSDGTTTTVR